MLQNSGCLEFHQEGCGRLKTKSAAPEKQPKRARPLGVFAGLKALRLAVSSIGLELLHSYSAILFLRSSLIGAIVLGCSFISVNIGLSGLLCWTGTMLWGRLAGIGRGDPVRAIYSFNALLAGFAIGLLFPLSILSCLLIGAASLLTMLVSSALLSLLSKSLNIPVLNAPFLIVATLVNLAAPLYGALGFNPLFLHPTLNLDMLPMCLHGLLRSLGALIFMPYDICGILLLIGLLAFSRIAFFLAVLSYYVGTTVSGLFLNSFAAAYSNLHAFNFILIGIGLGGIFLVPSLRTYVLASAAVFLSVFVLDAASVASKAMRIPIFTLPFNFVVLLVLYALKNREYPMLTRATPASPEQALDQHINVAKRFARLCPKPFLPFAGRWTVSQGFNGAVTHKGIWRYAYDFVIKDEKNLTHSGAGDRVEQYHCFGKPIFSPVAGMVIDATDSIEDNRIGIPNEAHRWGNYIIIFSHFGYYVEISHLKFSSLKVAPGDSVAAGQLIAECGNSGYSYQPHLHFQVQSSPRLGSGTIPFDLTNAMNGNKTLIEGKPLSTGMTVEPLFFSRKLWNRLSFAEGESFSFKSCKNGRITGEFQLRAGKQKDGAMYFAIDGSEAKLFFGLEDDRFVFYSYTGNGSSPLRLLFAALPGIPLCSSAEIGWSETIPGGVIFENQPIRSLLSSFNHRLGMIGGRYRFVSEDEIRGELSWANGKANTQVLLDESRGFKKIRVEKFGCDFTLIRV